MYQNTDQLQAFALFLLQIILLNLYVLEINPFKSHSSYESYSF
jgi:hypothetical protein